VQRLKKEGGIQMFRLKVKEVAESTGTSQRQLFLRSGVDITTIRKIFRDPQTVVTVETLTRLAEVLDVDVSTLIESVPDQPGQPKRPKRPKRPKQPKQPDQPAKPVESNQPDPDNTPAP
jgi:transcriptional regulator with XRE-family HTH domain